MTRSTIPLIDLAAQGDRIRSEVDKAIARVLDHHQFVLGPEVAELERRLSARSAGVACVSCGSGTDALLLAMLALGVGAGDAVVVPSFSFAAPAEVAALLGATPVFADVDPGCFTLAPDSADAALTLARSIGLHPRLVVAVDLYGHPADDVTLEEVARRHGARLVVDAAQSFGASRNDIPACARGSIATTSFFPSKPLACYGEGGAVFTQDEDIADVVRSLRTHGQSPVDKYDHVRVGFNARLETLQAAVLLVKLTVLDDELAARGEAAHRYGIALEGLVGVPTVAAMTRSAWAHYTVTTDHRERLRRELDDQGVATAVHYPRPLHEQTAFKERPRVDDLGTSEALARQVLSLPMHGYLDEATQERICRLVAAIVRRESD